VLKLASQGERGVAPLHGLVWIAQVPEGVRRSDEARHARILMLQGDLRTVELRFIDCHPEFRVFPSPSKLAQDE
jgi:hypothetical protein